MCSSDLANAPQWLLARFEHSAVPIALLRGQGLAMKGDAAAARAAFAESERLLEAARSNPVTEVDAVSNLGLAYAGLGRKQAALESSRAAVERLRSAGVDDFFPASALWQHDDVTVLAAM